MLQLQVSRSELGANFVCRVSSPALSEPLTVDIGLDVHGERFNNRVNANNKKRVILRTQRTKILHFKYEKTKRQNGFLNGGETKNRQEGGETVGKNYTDKSYCHRVRKQYCQRNVQVAFHHSVQLDKFIFFVFFVTYIYFFKLPPNDCAINLIWYPKKGYKMT